MSPSLEVRPLHSGQEDLWYGCDPGDQANRDALATLLTRPDHREQEHLLLFAGGHCVGRVQGEYSSPTVYSIRSLHTHASVGDSDAASALSAYFYTSFLADGIQIFLPEQPATAVLRTALEQQGFQIHRRKLLVRRQIDGYRPPYETPFTYRTLAEAGRRVFLAVLTAASEGDPFEEEYERNPEREFDELVDYAGPAFDPGLWRIALLDGVPAGVLLPQPYHDEPQTGTLFYLGLLPAFRGRGLGSALHAAGLEMLAQLQCTTYIGSTDEANRAMARVFTRNGCEVYSSRLFYRPAALPTTD